MGQALFGDCVPLEANSMRQPMENDSKKRLRDHSLPQTLIQSINIG
jgi:hypothetical protein